MAFLSASTSKCVYFVCTAFDEWPVSFIRISSVTPALASAELKLCRSEWNVRLVKFRAPFP